MLTKIHGNRRVSWVALLALLLTVLLLAGCGDDDKEAPMSYEVGIINPNPYATEIVDSFKNEMTARGLIEGDTITYFVGSSAQALTRSISADKLDLLLVVGGTFGGSEVNALTQAKELSGGKIPIVTAPGSGDPAKTGDAISLAQPGHNITGLLLMETDVKRFELFLNLLPVDTKTVAVIYNPDNEGAMKALPDIEALAQQRSIEPLEFPSPSFDPQAGEQAFADMADDVGGIFLLKVWGLSLRWFDWAYQHRVPTSQDGRLDGPMPQPLLAYGPDSTEIGKLAAGFADQILKGSKPGKLPMQYTNPILIIDLGVAEGMAFEVPERTVSLADEIYHTDPSVFTVQPDAAPLTVNQPVGTGACAADQVTMGGSFRVCVPIPCDQLPSGSFLRYENSSEVGGCTEQGLVGTCKTSTLDIHYYDGDPGSLQIGCGFQTGEWHLAGS